MLAAVFSRVVAALVSLPTVPIHQGHQALPSWVPQRVADLLTNGPRAGPTLPPGLWNQLYSWWPGVRSVTTPAAPPIVQTTLYALGVLIILGTVRQIQARRRAGRVDLDSVVDAPEPSQRRPADRRTHGHPGGSHRPTWSRRRKTSDTAATAHSPGSRPASDTDGRQEETPAADDGVDTPTASDTDVDAATDGDSRSAQASGEQIDASPDTETAPTQTADTQPQDDDEDEDEHEHEADTPSPSPSRTPSGSESGSDPDSQADASTTRPASEGTAASEETAASGDAAANEAETGENAKIDSASLEGAEKPSTSTDGKQTSTDAGTADGDESKREDNTASMEDSGATDSPDVTGRTEASGSQEDALIDTDPTTATRPTPESEPENTDLETDAASMHSETDTAPTRGGILVRLRRWLPGEAADDDSAPDAETDVGAGAEARADSGGKTDAEAEGTASGELEAESPIDSAADTSPATATESQRATSEPAAPETTPDTVPETPDEIAEAHQRLVAPDSINWDLREPKVGEQYAKTLHITDFPDYPKDGYLHELFEVTDAEFDMTLYFRPRNQNRTRERLKRRADDLGAKSKITEGAGSGYLATEAMKMRAGHNAMERGVRAFSTAGYISIRGDTVEDLRANEATLRRVLTDDAQASLDVRTTYGKQDVLLQSASPLGPDIAARRNATRYSHIQLAGGLAATLSSFEDPSLMESGGVEHGRHKDLKTPIVVDPFKRENGFSKMVFADQGGGKSHSQKATFLRMMTQRDDCIGIILEPLGNWEGVAEAMDAEHIVVGGDKQINPLDIQPLSSHARERMRPDEAPLKDKKAGVMGWLRNYFRLRGLELGDELVTLDSALDDAYARRGIYEGEYDTFRNASPTIGEDLYHELKKRERSPEDYADTDYEVEQIKQSAAWLRRQLRPFNSGQFSALGGASDVDLSGSDIIYLDLGQEEGGDISDQAALTMQLLIDRVYQRAKQTQKKTVFCIDEFHYISDNAVNLKFMETLLRHHRHHEISPWLITQTVDEFLDNAIADRILKLTTMTQFHHIDSFGAEQAEPFDLSRPMQEYVRNAAPGSEDLGYSDGLIGIDGEWRRMEVVTLPEEKRVIEYDADLDTPADLPDPEDIYAELPAAQPPTGTGGVDPDGRDPNDGYILSWGGDD